MLKPQTLTTLAELENASWFSAVGKNDTEVAKVLSSWGEAIANSQGLEWKNLRTEAANQYRARLAEKSPEHLRQWNLIVREVKPLIMPLVKKKIEVVVTRENLPIVFEHAVMWDILHVCMEAEYADVYPPGFYASQAYWYVKGHFPCGWEGQFPNGKVVIF